MTRRRLLPLLAVLGLLGRAALPVLPAAGASNADYLPLEVGARWTFVGSDGHEVSEVVRGSVDIRDAGGNALLKAAAVAAADGSEFYYIRTDKGVLKLYEPPKGLPEPDRSTWVLRFPLSLGSSWESWTPAGRVEFRVTDRRAITAPDGSLVDGVRVDFLSVPEPIFQGHIWYAKGIGPVEVAEGDYTRKLLGYRRGNGPEIPVASGLAGLEPPSIDKKRRLGRKGWFALVLVAASLVGVAALPRLRRRPVRSWELDDDRVRLEAEGAIPEQIARLEAAIGDSPGYADLRCKLAALYGSIGRGEDAISQYRRALEINPSYVAASVGLTRAYLEAGRAADALAAIDPVAAKHPTYADVQNLRGEALLAGGDAAGAVRAFESSLSINPNYEAAKKNLELARARLGGGAEGGRG